MSFNLDEMIKEEDEIEILEIYEKSIVKAMENTQEVLRELGIFENEDQDLPEGF